MKKYYGLFIIPLLGIVSINNGTKINLNQSNLKSENAVIMDIETSSSTSTAIIDTNLDGYGDTLYMWGANELNEILAHGSMKQEPEKIDYDWGGNLIDIEAGYGLYGASVDTDFNGYADTIYMWGYNGEGRLGNGTSDIDASHPEKITPKGKSDWGGNIIDFQSSYLESGVIVDTDLDGYADTLYVWGALNELLIDSDDEDYLLYPQIITPRNEDNWNGNIIDWSIGMNGIGIVIDNNDKISDDLYIWGGTTIPNIYYFYPRIIYPNIKGDKNWGHITNISMGEPFNVSVIADSDYDGYSDSIYLWGKNEKGMLGNGESNNKILIPNNNEFITDKNIIDVDLGSRHTGVIVDTDLDNYADTVYMAGDNKYGQIGNENTGVNALLPTIITPKDQDNWGGNILKISVSQNQSMLLLDQDKDGLGDTVYVWGSDSHGQLGLGEGFEDVDIPTQLATTYY